MAYSVPAVETAIKLLNYLKANAHSQKSLAEVCDALGIPRSSGFNIMKTLEKHGFVKFDNDSKRYSLGWAMVELGTKASEQMNYVEVVRPYLRTLGRETSLTCVLAQRAGDQLLILDKVESSNDIRVTATVGQLYPLAAGALGKVLMAYLSSKDIESYLARYGLPSVTQNAITDIDVFLLELAEVRRVGFAKSLEEYVRGVNVVASPIFDASGGVSLTVAALGLVSALPAEQIEEFGSKVLSTAQRMTNTLGGAWQGPAV
ncbi:MAG: IclR family transcriptional regulator [Chloroflexi bacterium]|nr:IclR family transcriptional regulator [Chloroflexota bacterium]MDA8187847.1 IclR family transcriptional regulator [Dehalococcoidales bacterium]